MLPSAAVLMARFAGGVCAQSRGGNVFDPKAPIPLSVSKEERAFELARSYEEKYEGATSEIHHRWTVFFDHELMRQVLRTVQMKENDHPPLAMGDVQEKFSSLFHVRNVAVRMKGAAEATERRRRDELRGLRKRCRGAAPGSGDRREKRRAVAAPTDVLVRAATVDDERLFDRIASFV